MDLIVCDDVFVFYCMLYILVCLYIFLCIAVYKYQKILVFFGPARNIIGAYHRAIGGALAIGGAYSNMRHA
jgi:hypothetical protein